MQKDKRQKKTKIKTDLNIKITPNSLSGTERKIVKENKKYHLGITCIGLDTRCIGLHFFLLIFYNTECDFYVH